MLKHLPKGLSLAIFFFVTSLGANSENPYDVTHGNTSTLVERHVTHASWYGPRFFGHTMACGEQYDENAVFTANKTYPLGTKLMVTNLRNHRSIIVAVKDRGPYVAGRDLDLSYEAAKKLDMIRSGVVLVSYIRVRSS